MRDRSRPTSSSSPAGAGDDASSGGASTDQDPGGRSPALARLYMTSDLRAATGLTRTHLDFYLREGVIVPIARTESGYLLFDDEELSVLRKVIAWRQDGVGVHDIRLRLGRGVERDADGGGQ